MGFMAELESSELSELSRLATDQYTVDERMMLHVKAVHEGQVVLEDDALNDAVITKGAVARTIQLSVRCDNTEMMSFGGDGVVISTDQSRDTVNVKFENGNRNLRPSFIKKISDIENSLLN